MINSTKTAQYLFLLAENCNMFCNNFYINFFGNLLHLIAQSATGCHHTNIVAQMKYECAQGIALGHPIQQFVLTLCLLNVKHFPTSLLTSYGLEIREHHQHSLLWFIDVCYKTEKNNYKDKRQTQTNKLTSLTYLFSCFILQ